MTEREIAPRLLEYLRRAIAEPSLAYLEPLARLTGGFENLVFGFALSNAPRPLSGSLVLRLFDESQRAERAHMEAAVHNALVELRYPAPRVLLAEPRKGFLGQMFLVMERLPGRTLAAEFEGLGRGRSFGELVRLLVRAPKLVRDISRTMAIAQIRLHRLPTGPVMRAVESAGLPIGAITLPGRLERLARQSEGADFAELRPGVEWLFRHRPEQTAMDAVCHCDFQPFNIMCADGRVTGILDWEKVTLAPPEMDVGSTLGNLRTVPLQVPEALYGIFQMFMKTLSGLYYRSYRRLQALDDRAVQYHQVFRSLRELAGVVEALVAARPNLGVYGSAKGIGNLVAHVRQLTGVNLRIDFASLHSTGSKNVAEADVLPSTDTFHHNRL